MVTFSKKELCCFLNLVSVKLNYKGGMGGDNVVIFQSVGIMFTFWWIILAIFAWTTLIIFWRKAKKED